MNFGCENLHYSWVNRIGIIDAAFWLGMRHNFICILFVQPEDYFFSHTMLMRAYKDNPALTETTLRVCGIIWSTTNCSRTRPWLQDDSTKGVVRELQVALKRLRPRSQ